ncbi:hypothetical protein FD04_GL000821 [Secundilactobacillus odoratitofui DSM 19909 = JCM 15043]|uniref:Uncharacterized protein n=1 Tax=Secundilactobacillus odoratitofui DSM 19909 = JCM 15043 TaxID=1423776 RepID=A0A0R1LY50_9LACO|nr:hypothetical protein [Secundilactobacillus odoratitofui]KRK97849.1 hypothetical protein FD04_GL000821 [Secundilactobacillus odoratitofui DSM 19909 = JCM 15043]
MKPSVLIRPVSQPNTILKPIVLETVEYRILRPRSSKGNAKATIASFNPFAARMIDQSEAKPFKINR